MPPPTNRSPVPANSFVRINGKIRARDVRVVGDDGKQLGIFPLAEALQMARAQGVDLVEISPNAVPPVCRIVDFGKWRYEQAKKEKEAAKAHANKVKEVQLSANIDPHDFGVKLRHAVDFLCDDMKVKVTLRFRGREMAHQEFGFQQVNKFITEIQPWGHSDFNPKLTGRNIYVMISPLPRNKRAKHPKEAENEEATRSQGQPGERHPSGPAKAAPQSSHPPKPPLDSPPPPDQGGFGNNPFTSLNLAENQR